jgi:hypothetical protein
MIVRRIPGSWIVLAGMLLFCFFLQQKRVFSQDSIPVKEPGYFAISPGIYSCLDLWATTGFVNLQLQPAWKLWVLRPQIGALVSFSGAFMFYGGLVWPASPVKWLVIQTGAAVGYYESGSGIYLTFPLEFRLSLSILYKFRNSAQLGIEISHISNANLGPPNPGTEAIGLIFQLPVRNRDARSDQF